MKPISISTRLPAQTTDDEDQQQEPRPRRMSALTTASASTSSSSVLSLPPALPVRSPLRKSNPPTPQLSMIPSHSRDDVDTTITGTGRNLLHRPSFASVNRLIESISSEYADTEGVYAAAWDALEAANDVDQQQQHPSHPDEGEEGPRTSYASTNTFASTSTHPYGYRHSIASSMTAASIPPTSPIDSTPPLPPIPITPKSVVSFSSEDGVAPKIPKRTHALLELLTSERSYASDLALMCHVHIPLATGKPATLTVTATGLPALSADPPMRDDDVKAIFGNVPDLAAFSTGFSDEIQIALASVLENNGDGHDCVGALFLDAIPRLEPKYKTYITRHPTALEHLNKIKDTPAMVSYLAYTQVLSSALTSAWDLSSFLIKPVQRLLKYPLLLQAIIADTDAAHPDRDNLILAKERLEEVARAVNEGRRRYEVVKEVLSTSSLSHLPNATSPTSAAHAAANGMTMTSTNDEKKNSRWKQGKKGMQVPVGVTASAQLARMKAPLRAFTGRPKEPHADESTVDAAERELKAGLAFAELVAKEALAWADAARTQVRVLHGWALAFGRVIGLADDQESEAFDAFLAVLAGHLAPLCDALEQTFRAALLPALARLKESSKAPIRLLEALHALEPLHYGLLHLNFGKTRPPPALLEASQSYIALRGQLAAELPTYVELLRKGVGRCLLAFAEWQAGWFAGARDRWAELWDALRVDGEMNAGAEETTAVWHSRWEAAEMQIAALGIMSAPKEVKASVGSKGKRRSLGSEKEKEREREREAMMAREREMEREHEMQLQILIQREAEERERQRVREAKARVKEEKRLAAMTPQVPAVSTMLHALSPSHAVAGLGVGVGSPPKSLGISGRTSSSKSARSPSPLLVMPPGFSSYAPSKPRTPSSKPSQTDMWVDVQTPMPAPQASLPSPPPPRKRSSHSLVPPGMTKMPSTESLSVHSRPSVSGPSSSEDHRMRSMPIAPRRSTGTSVAPESPSLDMYAAGAMGFSTHSSGMDPAATVRVADDRRESRESKDSRDSRESRDSAERDKDRGRKPSFRRKMSGALDTFRSPASQRSSSKRRERERESSSHQHLQPPSSPLSQRPALTVEEIEHMAEFGMGGLELAIPGVPGSFFPSSNPSSKSARDQAQVREREKERDKKDKEREKTRKRSGSGSVSVSGSGHGHGHGFGHGHGQGHGVSVPREPLYRCAVVHACEPPPGVSYRALPFFHLREGMVLDVLREEGHPSSHDNLPLYVDDGDDCLLLVRDQRGQVGWALASFLVPSTS